MNLNALSFYFKSFQSNFCFAFDREILPMFRMQQTHFHNISVLLNFNYVCRYLATGDSQASVAMVFRVSKAFMSIIVRQTCLAIWEELQGSFLSQPTMKSEWEEIADGFWNKWNFPNCLGALDGKHVCIQAPPKSGSEFYNFQKSIAWCWWQRVMPIIVSL